MVCGRCKAAVSAELDKAGLDYSTVELGEIELTEPVDTDRLSTFRSAVEPLGFEVIEDKAARQVSQIKKEVIGWVRSEFKGRKKLKFSAHLSDVMHKDYASLSSLFSSVESSTIEQYLINQKIEYVKELLVYDEYSLAEIADKLGYSSVQHLSNQFKKITGLTPGHFKKIGASKRRPIDEV